MAIKFHCPHCDKVHAVGEDFAGKTGTCSGCKGKLIVPRPAHQRQTTPPAPPTHSRQQPPQPIAVESNQNPFAFLDAAPHSDSNEAIDRPFVFEDLSVNSRPSISAKLGGSYRGRYVVNHKEVIFKFTGTAIEAATYTMSPWVGLLIGVAAFACVILLLAGAFVFLGIGNSSAMIEDLPGIMLIKVGAAITLPLLICATYYLATKLGRQENLQIEKNTISQVRALGKWATRVGEFTVLLECSHGALRLSVASDAQTQLCRFVSEATGIDVK